VTTSAISASPPPLSPPPPDSLRNSFKDDVPARKFGVTLAELRNSGVVDVAAMPRILKRVIGLTAPYKAHLFLAIGAALGSTLFNLLLPRLLGRAVDQAHSLLAAGASHADEAEHALYVTAALLIGAATLRGLLQMISGYKGEYVAQRVGYDLRLAFFEKLQRLDFEYHDRNHSGDLITRGMLDLEGVRGFVEMGMQRAIMLTLLVSFGCWSLVNTDPILAVLALSFVPFVLWRALHSGLYLRLTWTRLQERMSILTRTMEENLQGVRVVRAFAGRAFELLKFDWAAGEALRLSNHRIMIRSGSVSTMTFAYYLSMASVLWVGGHRVEQGLISIGHLTEVLTFMTILQMPIRQINMIVNSSARATSSGVRLFEILDMEPKVRDHENAPDLVLTKGILRFEHVGFSYGGPEGTPVLRDISFEVGPGKTLGIIGPPGSGKSTLAHLVPRFYDVTSGRITLDGQDIRDVTLHSLRGAVGVIPQDVFLFDASVAENVAYGDPDADPDRLVEATSTAQIHDYLSTLPESYETRVGERGVSLSGGQRQRLSIARGVVPDPTLLVFDDATSAVDAATEHRVRGALQDATRDKGTIIIAHRLSSLMHADEIIVLDQGEIVERGTHAELLRLGKRYAALYKLQSSQATGGLEAQLETAPAASQPSTLQDVTA